MASNIQLQAEAEELAATLNTTVDHAGLNNAQLAALVSDLKDQVKALPVTETETETETETVYQVAEGKSITSKAGIKVAGNVVKAEHFPKGTLEHLVEVGVVVTA